MPPLLPCLHPLLLKVRSLPASVACLLSLLSMTGLCQQMLTIVQHPTRTGGLLSRAPSGLPTSSHSLRQSAPLQSIGLTMVLGVAAVCQIVGNSTIRQFQVIGQKCRTLPNTVW